MGFNTNPTYLNREGRKKKTMPHHGRRIAACQGRYHFEGNDDMMQQLSRPCRVEQCDNTVSWLKRALRIFDGKKIIAGVGYEISSLFVFGEKVDKNND